MRRLLVVVACLLSLAAGAQSLQVGPEQRTALPDDGPAVLLQFHPAVASDGRDFLVLWNDGRYGATLVAARVSGDGELLGAPFRLPVDGYAHVMWSGSEYVVIGAGAYGTKMIHVGRNGAILGEPRVLSPQFAYVAFGRASVALAVHDNSYRVFTQTFDLRGRPLGPLADASAALPDTPLSVAISSNGSDVFALAMMVQRPADGRGIWFRTIARNGALSPAQRISEAAPLGLQVGGTAEGFTVTWWEDGAQYLLDVEATGEFRRRGLTTLPFVSPPNVGAGLAIGGELWLSLSTFTPDLTTDARFVRHRNGAPPQLVSVANSAMNEFEPVLATNGENFLLVWCDDMNVVYELTGRDARRVLTTMRGYDIPRSSSAQQRARGAAGGSTTLLVWYEEYDIFRPSIAAGRLGPDGELLDGRGFRLSDRAMPGTSPQIAFDGSVFVAVWTERDAKRLAGTRVSPAGEVLDAQPFELEAAGVGAVTVASDGRGNTAVVYVIGDELRMRVIGSSGVVSPAIPLAATARAIAEPSVTFDGSAFLVAWTEYERNPDYCTGFRCPGPYLWSDVRGARVTDRVLQARTLFAAAGRNDYYYSPRALLAKGGPAIAYRHGQQLVFARLDEQLSVDSPRVFAGSIYFPEISVIAGVPLVAWFDEGGIRIVALNHDLTRSASEAVIQPAALWVWGATIVPGPASGWVLYSRSTTEEEPYGLAPRTFARELEFGPRRARPLRR